MFRHVLPCALGLLALAGTTPVSAESYPSKPIYIVIPFEVGGPTDILIRAIEPIVTKEMGQPVIIENKGGAGSVIGASYVARSAPDGYTFLVGGSPTSINASFVRKLPYDTEKDLAAVSPLAKTNYFLIASGHLPVNSVQELIALAKRSPGTITYASSGLGNRPHLAGAQFALLTHTKLLHVPYKGTGPATNDLVAGHVDIMFGGLVTAFPFVKSHQLKALAVAMPHRDPALPDVPTLAEAGVPDFYPDVWYGLLTRNGTPQAIKEKMSHAVQKALANPETVKRYAAMGATPFVGDTRQFQSFFDADVKVWHDFFQANPDMRGE
jgi:tripartite-type tricarboxylate transporter receptor subunit TctC